MQPKSATIRRRAALALHLTAALLASSLRGEEAPVSLDFAVRKAERKGPAWLEPYDPTLLSRRILTEVEYQDLKDGEVRGKLQWNLRYAVTLDENVALGFLMNVPFAWAKAQGHRESGFGDLELRAGVLEEFAPAWRGGIGLNVKLPTARNDILGDGIVELRPILALSWDATSRLNLGVNVEYNFTPRDEGSSSVSALELRLPAAFEFSDRWSAFASYNPRWNFRDGDALRHRMELGLTRVFGSHEDCALSIGVEIPLTRSNETIDWKCNVGFTWHFQ